MTSKAWVAIAACAALTVGCSGQVHSQDRGTAPLTAAPDGRKLVLAFADEFDSFRPLYAPSGVWRTRLGDGRVDDVDQRTLRPNGELQLYVDPNMLINGAGGFGLDPFEAKDGKLNITAAPMPAANAPKLGGYRYSSGIITTQPSFHQLYGYFEMRAALPRGKGLWPAFWLLPADLSWPPEIDVMESIGDPNTVYVTAHSKTKKAEGIKVDVKGDGFHTFAVAWDPKQLVWYVDGAEVGRQPTPPDMNKPMYMLANLALGGGWAGPPDASTKFPARLSIDYIRAYRFAP